MTKHSQNAGGSIGEGGLPGVFFIYELSPMMVKYTEKQRYVCFFFGCLCPAVCTAHLRDGLTLNVYLRDGLTLNAYLRDGLTLNVYLRDGLTLNVYLRDGLLLNVYLRDGLALNVYLRDGLTLNMYLRDGLLLNVYLRDGLLLNVYLRDGLLLNVYLRDGLILNVYLRDEPRLYSMCCPTGLKLQIKLAISPSHGVLPPGQPGQVLTLFCQAHGRAAT